MSKGEFSCPWRVFDHLRLARELLLNHVNEEDIVSFTGDRQENRRGAFALIPRFATLGSRKHRSRPAYIPPILGPDCAPGTDLSDLLVKDVVANDFKAATEVHGHPACAWFPPTAESFL